MGQLPAERVTPDLIFNRVGVDYPGPLQLVGGIYAKTSYCQVLCVYLVLSLFEHITDAFMACLRWFISCR